MRVSKAKARERKASAETRRLLRAREAAEYLNTTEGALRADRHSPGMAIPYCKLGRAVRYDIRELDKLIEARTVRPEAAA
jgi:hypothetical protein